MRRLIINADDFGLTRGVNRAIVESHQHGIVTSTTLMANGTAFDDAVGLLSSIPRISVGCHVVLVDGAPILKASQVPSLLAAPTPHFPDELSKVVLRALRGRLDAGEIEAEVTAQICKLQATGITLSHVDTHKHTHLFPQVLRPLLKAARACGLKAVRNPFGRLSFAATARRPYLWKRYTQVNLLHRFAAPFQRAVADAGLMTPDGSLGVVATGALDEALFRSMVKNLPEGTWEFVCHPGYNDAELAGVRTRLRESRERELEVLTSEATRDFLRQCGITLISYSDFTC